jgi:tRNA pseudouridine38-40 synthase
MSNMRAAASLLVGRHDFQSFSANPDYDHGSTVRTLTRCDLKRSGPLLTFIIEGDGFLSIACVGGLWERWSRWDWASSAPPI